MSVASIPTGKRPYNTWLYSQFQVDLPQYPTIDNNDNTGISTYSCMSTACLLAVSQQCAHMSTWLQRCLPVGIKMKRVHGYNDMILV